MKVQQCKKFAVYSRKSKFTGKGESIENQIELCRQRLYSMEVPERDILVFEDEGFSGGNTNRPQFQAMMREIRAGKIRGVICYRLDRISRNVADFAEIQKEFGEYGVDFISLRDNFDTTTPTGRAMMMMTSVFAQLERETIAERIRDNMYELAKSGRWLGGRTPTGFYSKQITGSVTVDGKVHRAYRLESIPEELSTVRLVYAKFLETRSLTKVDSYLLEHGVFTKNGKQFTRFSISAILRNPVYLIADDDAWEYFVNNDVEVFAEQSEFDGKHGVMAYNKTIQKPGKPNQTRNMEDWIISVGKHEGTIPGADWVRVQELLDRNKSKSYRRPKSNVALLSGILYCGNCGGFMRPKLTQRTNAAGESIYTYICGQKERSHGSVCDMKNINGNTLDQTLCEQIHIVTEDSSEFHKQLEKVKKALEQNRFSHADRLAGLLKEEKEIEQQIGNLVSTLAASSGSAAAEYITGQINELHARKENRAQQIEEIKSIAKDTDYSSAGFEILRKTMQDFGATFSALTVEQKRAAFKVFLHRIVWDGENVHVFLLGDQGEGVEVDGLFREGEMIPLGEDSK